MDKMYLNIYNIWNKYSIKKYSMIKYKCNNDTMNLILSFILIE